MPTRSPLNSANASQVKASPAIIIISAKLASVSMFAKVGTTLDTNCKFLGESARGRSNE